MTYPKPDRSDQVRNFVKSADNETLDIGWSEGALSDGRPYCAECWAEDQLTLLTLFLSSLGMESYTDDMFRALLEAEGLVRFLTDDRYVSAKRFMDAGGNDVWSVNIVIGDDETLFAKDNVHLNAYARAAT